MVEQRLRLGREQQALSPHGSGATSLRSGCLLGTCLLVPLSYKGPTLRTSSKPNQLPKPPPKTIPQGARTSTHGREGTQTFGPSHLLRGEFLGQKHHCVLPTWIRLWVGLLVSLLAGVPCVSLISQSCARELGQRVRGSGRVPESVGLSHLVMGHSRAGGPAGPLTLTGTVAPTHGALVSSTPLAWRSPPQAWLLPGDNVPTALEVLPRRIRPGLPYLVPCSSPSWHVA